MMVMGFECKECDYKVSSSLYVGYDIIDGERHYYGHPGDCFATYKERPYIHKETHVIKWFTDGDEIPEDYVNHIVEMILYGDKEQNLAHTPFCPNCKKELKMSSFIGCT
jgi:hypothetical protein